MTEAEIEALVEGMAPVVKQYVAQRVDGLVLELTTLREAVLPRVDAVEKSLAAITARPHVKFCGIWATGSEYQPGDAVTHQGGLWICKAATPGKPHEDFAGWQLAVKRGGAG